MLTIGPQLGSYLPIGDHVIRKLEMIYNETQQTIRKAEEAAEGNINAYVKELTAITPAQEQTAATSDGSGNPPIDEKDVGEIDASASATG